MCFLFGWQTDVVDSISKLNFISHFSFSLIDNHWNNSVCECVTQCRIAGKQHEALSFSWKEIMVKEKKGNCWMKLVVFRIFHFFSHKSVTQMTILMSIWISHVYTIVQDGSLMAPSPSLLALQLKEKTWEAKGERKEWGENLDKDRYRWVVGAQMLLENSFGFGKQTSSCSPSHRPPTRCRGLRWIYSPALNLFF